MEFMRMVMRIQKHLTHFSILAIGMLASILILATACKQKLKDKSISSEQVAPLLEGMGNHHFKVSARDTLVAKYFNQGIMLTYGFNHAEAERTFRQVTLLDPQNPMAWWGVALVQGPNINLAMQPEAVSKAWEALLKAQELKQYGSQREQDYIDALANRYSENPPEDRTPLDEAYAEAMGRLADKYPDDLDARALYAEAMMDLHPWDFWTKDGQPRPWTPKILETLEYVIQRNPDHPMANHLYIHATEASPTPEKALASARRLGDAVPGAGHLVHMPAHTYIRVGMYHEGSLANERAVKADNEYVTQCRAQGIYPLGYVPHNHHFLWATATMEGRQKLSREAAQHTSDLVDQQMMRQPGLGTLQHYWIIPLYGYVRFGNWDEILNYSKPDSDLIYPLGVWHYARGMAFLGKNDPAKAQQELNALKQIVNNDALQEITIWDINTTRELMQIASNVLEGEIAAQNRQYDTAIALLSQAASIEDQLQYNEPPDWFFPVRHNLGAILLEANRPAEAETIYTEDLKEFPKNGWSLYGLMKSLLAQGRVAQAQLVKAQFEKAWKYSDIELTSSRILSPAGNQPKLPTKKAS